MKKEETRKKIKSLMGNDLLPDSTEIKTLKLELPDILIFKESIDIEFGDIFNLEEITSSNTIGDLADYVEKTVSAQNEIEKKEMVAIENIIPDSIGFLIQDLAANDTTPIEWSDLPEEVKKIFAEAVNAGIDKTKAVITYKDKLYIFSYLDAEQDFSAAYIVFEDKFIFNYEN
jgi:hypothetical protein